MPRSSASKPKPPRTLAAQADRHALYERAVQDPEGDVKFFARTYRKIRGHEPISMREDFCGTAALFADWARSSPARTAMGVDLSQDTINSGLERHIVPQGRAIASRINLVCADVREVKKPKVDLTCALNFSYYCFKQRAELLDPEPQRSTCP